MNIFEPRPKGWRRFHRRLTEDGLSSIANVLRAKLESIYQRGTKEYHKWAFTPYWMAESRVHGDDLILTVSPRDQAYFEFFTTANPIVQGVNAFSTPSNKAICVGVTLDLNVDKITATPRILKGKRSFDGTELSLVKRPFQVQLINEPVVNPVPKLKVFGRDKYPMTLYESYAPLHSHTGVHRTAYTLSWTYTLINVLATAPYYEALPPPNAHNVRDEGFDIPYMHGTNRSPIVFGLLNDGNVDWPRASGVVTIKDSTFGDREFAIYIDAFGQFSVFPTSDIGPADGTMQNVPMDSVQTISPTLPAWVYVASGKFIDGGNTLDNAPEMDWKVHPEGTKACCIVYERVDATFDSAFYATAAGPHKLTSTIFDTFKSQQTGVLGREGDTAGPADTSRHQLGTGLIEATITIELTGFESKQYTLAMNVEEIRRPTTTEFCTLLAGYTSCDIVDSKEDKTFFALRGDLCVVDIERYYRASPQRPWAIHHTIEDVTYDAGSGVTTDPDAANPDNVFLETTPLPNLNRIGPDTESYDWTSSGVRVSSSLGESITHQTGEAHYGRLGGGLFTYPVYLSIPTFFQLQVYYAGDDTRRVLYSVKNLETDEEISTWPGFPSGVMLSDAEDTPLTWAHSSKERDDEPIVEETWRGEGPPNFRDVFDHLGKNAEIGLHFNTVPSTHSAFSTQIVDFDMSTLSLVLKVSTYEPQDDPVLRPGSPGNFNKFHHSYAVIIKNRMSRHLFPESMDDLVKIRQEAIFEDDFRSAYVSPDSAWTLMPMNDTTTWSTPHGDWFSTDLDSMRAQINHVNNLVDTGPYDYTIGHTPPTLSQPFVAWWGALGVYRDPIHLNFISNPLFMWHMYADLIQNSLLKTPWSTFFTHPNGTWALFDQMTIYNRAGTPADSVALPGGTAAHLISPAITYHGASGSQIHNGEDLAAYGRLISNDGPSGAIADLWNAFDVDDLEHCIFDWVHFEFKLSSSTVKLDTSFLKLYNDAITQGEKEKTIQEGEEFIPLTYDDMRTTFTKYTIGTGVNVQYGFTIDDWFPGVRFNWYEGTPISASATHSILQQRWNFMSLARVDLSAYTQHYTFSSCLLLD